MKRIASELQDLGVQYIAPSHCTGDHAMEYFQRTWGPNFISSGCGARISINGQPATSKE
jgi:7,8-dihydropterin-6-yl-methyl-4-(beta-D-ribofuranosyl)aminobenzene 5'-phosphate synthase